MAVVPLGVLALGLVMIATYTNCGKTATGGSGDVSSTRFTHTSITKNQGINIGEATSLWTAAMKAVNSTDGSMNVMIHNISLDALKGYPKKSWNLKVDAQYSSGGFGSRTFVSEWGLLVARPGGNGDSALYLIPTGADVNSTAISTPIVTSHGNIPGSRAAAISYKTTKNGIDYKFAGLVVYRQSGSQKIMRVERLLRNNDGSFTKMKPIEVDAAKFTSAGAVYKGFLDACSQTDSLGNCAPRFFGGDGGDSPVVIGVDLTQNNPPSPDDGLVLTQAPLTPINDSFTSTSHPKAGGSWGEINNRVYSFAGNPESGAVFKAFDTDYSSFVSYDRVNKIVFRVSRGSLLLPDGTKCTNNCAHSVVEVFDSRCFGDGGSIIDCNPTVATNPRSRIFTDVGESLGPTSDLGTGCVAMVGFHRPGEPPGIDDVGGVYKACINDPADLDKGLSVMKIGTSEGANYMYNDFTGATLYNRPLNILFDFTQQGYSSIAGAKLIWSPMLGYSVTASGLIIRARCYGVGKPPPAFSIISFGPGYIPTDIPGCGGAGVNQVELEISTVPGQKATRFQNITVDATKL